MTQNRATHHDALQTLTGGEVDQLAENWDVDRVIAVPNSGSVAIVTASDEAFAGMAGDLIESLGAWQRFSYVIDIGLTSESRVRLSALGATLLDGLRWDVPAAIQDRPYLRAMVLRPRLPDIVDAETIIWIDSDCWVQSPEVIPNLISASREHPSLLLVCDCRDAEYAGSRTFLGWSRNRWIFAKIRRHLFGWRKAINMWTGPLISTGVICGSRDAPAWEAWQRAADRVYRHRLNASSDVQLLHMGEQEALSSVLHRSNAYRLLPTESNWHCNLAGLKRGRSGVQSPVSGRRPSIVHLAASRLHADRYRSDRLFYERPSSNVNDDWSNPA